MGKFRDAYEIAIDIIKKPSRATEADASYKELFLYIFLIGFIPFFFYSFVTLPSGLGNLIDIYSILAGKAITTPVKILIYLVVSLVLTPLTLFIVILFLLIGSAFIHALGKIFRLFPGNFLCTFRSAVYSTTITMLFLPVSLLSYFLPIFSSLMWYIILMVPPSIYNLYVFIVGLSNQHNISRGRAAIIPISLTIISIVLSALFFSSFPAFNILKEESPKISVIGNLQAHIVYKEIITKSIETKNLQECNKIPQNGTFEISYYNECIYRNAESLKDISLCEKIIEDIQVYNKYLCKLDVGAISSNNSTKCTESIFPDDCYLDFATFNLDSSVCEKIDNNITKGECYFNLALLTQNKEYCNNIPYSHDKSECEFVLNRNVNDCESTFCYMSIAILNKDSDICLNMEKLKQEEPESSRRRDYYEQMFVKCNNYVSFCKENNLNCYYLILNRDSLSYFE